MEKKVALIGASGYVGKAILHELLERGWQVKALVRNPQNITIKIRRCAWNRRMWLMKEILRRPLRATRT